MPLFGRYWKEAAYTQKNKKTLHLKFGIQGFHNKIMMLSFICKATHNTMLQICVVVFSESFMSGF